jgi:hypothetical protein
VARSLAQQCGERKGFSTVKETEAGVEKNEL